MRCSPDAHRTGFFCALTLLTLIALSGPARARTWNLNAAGTGDAPTIQAAVDSVAAGDVILLAPGRYTWANQGGGGMYGMIFIPRGTNDFTIRGDAGARATILDAQNHSRCIYIQGYNSVLLEGLTFTGGNAPSAGYNNGGGVATHLSSDTIRDCIFEYNNATAGGGALWVGGVSTITLERCTFRRNTAHNGGAILFINSNTTSTVTDCVFDFNQSNSRGGAVYGYSNRLVVTNSIFSRNETFGESGGAVFLNQMWPSTFSNLTVIANLAASGSAFSLLESPAITLERSIVTMNVATAFASAVSSQLTASCNDIYNNGSNDLPAGSIDAGGNISEDAQICDVFATLNFFLHSTSPCAPGNHPDGAECGLIGALGVNCGGVRTETTSWGQVKALYR